MRHILGGLTAAALVAGCSGGGEETAGAEGIEPGAWQTTVTFTEIEAEGLPEGLAEMMREQLVGQPQVDNDCITPEQAADPGGQLLVPDDAGEDCNFERTVFADGAIDFAGSCSGPDGENPGEITVSGNYTPTTIDAEISVAGDDPTMGELRMTGTFSAERTGNCPAEGDADASQS